MKLVILAGGKKSSISEENEGIPKPMLEIGDRPLLWHIIKHASQYGITEFIICGGYKINIMKDYFKNFYLYQADFELDTNKNSMKILKQKKENWKILIINTGLNTSPARRIVQIEKYIDDDDFLVIYGDCLTNISYTSLIEQHIKSNYLATMGVAHPVGRKLMLSLDENNEFEGIDKLSSKNKGWTSAGVFAFKKSIFQYLNTDLDIEEILISSGKKLVAPYKHEGLWLSVETLRDKTLAERLWNEGVAPWIKEI